MLKVYYVEAYCDKNNQVIVTYLLGKNVDDLNEKLLLANYWPIVIQRYWRAPLRIGWDTNQLVKETQRWQLILASSIGLLPSLGLMKQQSRSKQDRVNYALWASLEQALHSGLPLSEALKDYAKFFPKFYTAVVGYSEESNQLVNALLRLSNFYVAQLERERHWNRLLRYPVFLLTCSAGFFGFKRYYLVPQLDAMISLLHPQRSQQSVLSTGELWKSSVSSVCIVILFFCCCPSIFPAKAFGATVSWMRLKLRQCLCYVPLYGNFYIYTRLSQLANMLLVLKQASLALQPSLAALEAYFQDTPYATLLHEAQCALHQGKPLSEGLKHRRWFPGLWTPLLILGEQTSQMKLCLERLIQYYDQELDRYSVDLSNWVQTWGMLLMGGVISYFLWNFYAPLLCLDQNLLSNAPF